MGVAEQIEYTTFESGEHLAGVLALCEAEGWESFPGNPELSDRALRAPGVTTVVAVGAGAVVGFAQMQSDGVVQAHLSVLAVDQRFRRRGIGRRLVEETAQRSGARRVDLISTAGAEGFYESFSHKRRSGFRIYPCGARGAD
ncbi:MAG: GNAT family N-acetyltransferase [Actinomycetota bacterium]|nr:GNAT family N-acetyltransferase [Actinomycetota bacterium]MDP9481219.1 GNAT family N-acetyltransferase [Actinomycetota bacterium]